MLRSSQQSSIQQYTRQDRSRNPQPRSTSSTQRSSVTTPTAPPHTSEFPVLDALLETQSASSLKDVILRAVKHHLFATLVGTQSLKWKSEVEQIIEQGKAHFQDITPSRAHLQARTTAIIQRCIHLRGVQKHIQTEMAEYVELASLVPALKNIVTREKSATTQHQDEYHDFFAYYKNIENSELDDDRKLLLSIIGGNITRHMIVMGTHFAELVALLAPNAPTTPRE